MEEADASRKRQCIEVSRYASPLQLLGPRPSNPTPIDQQPVDGVFPLYLQNLLTLDPLNISLTKNVTGDHGVPTVYTFETFYVGNVWNDATEGPSVLVRSCYKKMFEHVNKKITDVDKTPTIVTGTPGIGKSLFGLYAARRWFDANKLIILWYESKIFIFSKSKMNGGQNVITANGKSIWWMKVAENDDAFDQLTQDKNAILIRDPGHTKTVSPVNTLGFQLYNVSSGNATFIREMKKKPIPLEQILRHMDPFDYEELIAGYLCGCFVTSRGLFATPDSTDVAFFMEGYRRYGGSARNVVRFATLHRVNHFSPLEEYFLTLGPDQDIKDAVDWVAKVESSDTPTEVTSKALIFHRTPMTNPAFCDVHFASAYLQSMVVDRIRIYKNNALQKVIAALGAGNGQQDAYGVLYEGEMHKEITDGDAVVFKPAYLGSFHDGRQWKAKEEVELNYQVSKVLNFPGKSLANFKFANTSDVKGVYIRPIVGNFPTHDAFILVNASVFFEGTTTAGSSLVDNSLVLVGLQMTVSGNDDAKDKPSHKVHGTYLSDHYKNMQDAFMELEEEIPLLHDIVTLFIMPTDSCRKPEMMPVLAMDRKPLKIAIANFPGVAPQYCVVKEDKYIAGLMSDRFS